ncbi:phage major capsid protein [Serratia liquefaciens]|uniref:phage major capsid protein n=1 Tax=Serratia liquefaciens TaxID=614 RepID=UPI0021BD4440|nr:phage major capsid protein [Serratia liquefaciens]
MHGIENVDLTRLNDGAALLFNHKFDEHIGKVESASIDVDKIGRALVRFSSVGSGAEKFNMVREGILEKVSVGYEILDYEIQDSDLIVTRWMPFEISMVSVPADPSIGIGRSLEANYDKTVVEVDLENTDEVLVEIDTSESNKVDEVLVDNELDEVIIDNETPESINNEEERIAEINGIGRAFNMDVTTAIANGVSVDEFKRQVNEKENINIKDDNNMNKLTELLRSISGGTIESIKGSNGYEVESADLVRGFNATRAGVTTVTAAPITQTTVLYGSFVDALYGESVLANFPNVQRFTGLTSNISIPKLGADFTTSFGFVTENGTSPEVDPAFTSILMKPQTFTGSVPLSRQVLASCPQVEGIVANSIVRGSAQKLEQMILAKIVTDATAAGHVKEVAAFTYDDLVELQGEIADEGVPFGNIAAVMSPGVKATLRTTLRGTNTAAVYLFDDGMLAGIPAYDSKVLSGNEYVIIGDFGNLAIAEWNTMSVDYDDTTYRSKGASVVRVWADIDFVLTRPEAFRVLKLQA